MQLIGLLWHHLLCQLAPPSRFISLMDSISPDMTEPNSPLSWCSLEACFTLRIAYQKCVWLRTLASCAAPCCCFPAASQALWLDVAYSRYGSTSVPQGTYQEQLSCWKISVVEWAQVKKELNYGNSYGMNAWLTEWLSDWLTAVVLTVCNCSDNL